MYENTMSELSVIEVIERLSQNEADLSEPQIYNYLIAIGKKSIEFVHGDIPQCAALIASQLLHVNLITNLDLFNPDYKENMASRFLELFSMALVTYVGILISEGEIELKKKES